MARAGTKGIPRAQREDQIVDEACRAFGNHGYAATNLSDVAADAGISKPLIYNYFGSKDGLYAACLEHAGAIIAGEMERIARGEATGLERGMRTLEGLFRVLEPRPWLWRLFFDVSAPADGPAAEALRHYVDRISKLAVEGVTEMMHLAGNHDELDISAMTHVWMSIVDSLVGWWLDHPDETAAHMTRRCTRLISAALDSQADPRTFSANS